VKIDLFWNRFCQTSNIEARRVREVAAEFGEKAALADYDADDRGILRQYQLPRAIFIDGNEIGWGYEAPRNGIRNAIARALEEKGREALEFRLIRTDQYEDCLQLMLSLAGPYLEKTMELMQMDKRQFAELFRKVGRVSLIFSRSVQAGFYWIKERERVLHIHALILKKPFQGRGLGTAVLQRLEKEFRGRADIIEIGVHSSNERAIALYRRLGYKIHKNLDYLDFLIMQRNISAG
jgi:ribosomal protein S18 acetylase RimI-like enzyme